MRTPNGGSASSASRTAPRPCWLPACPPTAPPPPWPGSTPPASRGRPATTGARTSAAPDHTRAYEDGGVSTVDNLGPLCRHHHRMKHEGGWGLRQVLPGVFTWISPLDHHYTLTPPNLHNGGSG